MRRWFRKYKAALTVTVAVLLAPFVLATVMAVFTSGTDCSAFTALGVACWDTDDSVFYFGTGGSQVAITSGALNVYAQADCTTLSVGEGTLCRDTDDDTLYVYNGSVWEAVWHTGVFGTTASITQLAGNGNELSFDGGSARIVFRKQSESFGVGLDTGPKIAAGNKLGAGSIDIACVTSGPSPANDGVPCALDRITLTNGSTPADFFWTGLKIAPKKPSVDLGTALLPWNAIHQTEGALTDGTIAKADLDTAACTSIMAWSLGNPDETTTLYYDMTDTNAAGNATAANVDDYRMIQAGAASYISAWVDVAPTGATKNWVVSIWDADASTNVIFCTISDTATDCTSDGVAVGIAKGKRLAVKVTPQNSPAAAAVMEVALCLSPGTS